MQKTSSPVRSFFKYLVLGIVALIQLFPLYWLFTFSLKDNAEIFGENPMGLPQVFRWENYAYVFENGNIGVYLMNSTIVTAVSILLSTILAAMAVLVASLKKLNITWPHSR